ncbi:hypothetical protein [Proteiniphilum sp. UBA5431]|uniref:hypothetical protein n=1 Tax=Proteiniphilum sp. UBA5431 TaxID=1947280 RepID=UPI00257FF8CF|nr:hypothetical protein [Proteiniphilum sp. UBA5431]
MPNGDIITAGYTENPETKIVGIESCGKIYLSKLNADGKLIAEKYYGGSNYDTLYDATYVEKKALLPQ